MYKEVVGLKKLIITVLVVIFLSSFPVYAQESSVYRPEDGDIIVRLNEAYPGSSPEELFSELDIVDIQDLYGRLYESLYERHVNNQRDFNMDSLERLRNDLRTVFVITLADASEEAIFNAIAILEQNPIVAHAERNFVTYTWVSGSNPPPNIHTASNWSREGIISAYGRGFIPEELLIGSYGNGIFRQEFCHLAVRWLEYATGNNIDTILTERGLIRSQSAFTDTNDPIVLAAFALGITSGIGNNLFGPNNHMNHEQAATIIMNVCRVIGADTDNPPASNLATIGSASSWGVNGINFVINNNITPDFHPHTPINRGLAIVFFNNINPGRLPGLQSDV